MITVIVALVSLVVGVGLGYEYGHAVATKAAAEAAKIQKAVKDLR